MTSVGQIQQSYYSGPHPFGKAHPGWKGWPWNPIGSGDVYKHPSRILEHTNDEKTIYVKTIPMQWALDNVPGECTFETWITLEGQTAVVRNRLVNHRPDKTQSAPTTRNCPRCTRSASSTVCSHTLAIVRLPISP